MATPALAVAVTAEMNTKVLGTTGGACYAAGEDMLLNKGQASMCKGPAKIEGEKLSFNAESLGTLQPNENLTMDVPADASSVTIDADGRLLYFYGTESSPLSIPKDFSDIAEDAPQLLVAGENLLPLSVDGERITKIAVVNNTANPIQAAVKFKG